MTDVASAEASKRLGRRSAASIAGAAVSGLGTLVATVLITTLASQPVAGAVFAVTSFFLLLQSAGRLGSQVGLVWALTWVRTRPSVSTARTVLATSLLPGLLVGAVAAAAVTAFAPAISTVFGDQGDIVAVALRSGAVLVPLAAVYDGLTSATQGLGRLRPTVLIERIARPLGQVALVAIVAPTNSAALLTVAWFAPYVPAFVAMAWILRTDLAKLTAGPAGQPRLPGPPVRQPVTTLPGEQASPAEWRRWYWRFSRPRAVSDLAQTALQRLDIVLVGALSSLNDAAIYTVVTRLLVAGTQLSQALLIAAQPAIAERFARHDVHGAQSIWRRTTSWQILMTTPLSWVLVVQSAGILTVFGAGYAGGTAAAVILALAAVVARSVGPVDAVLVMSGHTRQSLYVQCLALVTNVAVDVVAIPRIGITGAALGWAAATLVANVGPLLLVRHLLSIDPWDIHVVTAVATAAVVWAGAFGLLTNTWGSELTRLVVSGVLCGVLYAVVVLGIQRSRSDAVPGRRDLAAGAR